jgi:hypothetical protein
MCVPMTPNIYKIFTFFNRTGIYQLLYNLSVHNLVQECRTLDKMFSQSNPFQFFQVHNIKIQFNIILPSFTDIPTYNKKKSCTIFTACVICQNHLIILTDHLTNELTTWNRSSLTGWQLLEIFKKFFPLRTNKLRFRIINTLRLMQLF